MTTDPQIHVHSMTRVDVFTGVGFEEFVKTFEAAAPRYDPVPMQRIVETGGTWDDVRAKVAENAPNELMVYAKIDAVPLLGVAGHDVKAVEYLLGNHVIAETMFRHDPRALLYAPLRVLCTATPIATRCSRWTNRVRLSAAWAFPRSPKSV